MDCPRCRGLLLDEDDARRCANCGHREFKREDDMPRFISEESRQRWLESVRRTAAKKRAAREGGPVDRMPATRAVSVRPADVSVVMSLDDKIAQLQADLAVLEQAREILAR